MGEPREDEACPDVGLTDAEWTRLRHAAGNRGDLGPIAEEFDRILAERVWAAVVEALRDAADDLEALVDAQHPDALNPDQWLRDRADRSAER